MIPQLQGCSLQPQLLQVRQVLLSLLRSRCCIGLLLGGRCNIDRLEVLRHEHGSKTEKLKSSLVHCCHFAGSRKQQLCRDECVRPEPHATDTTLSKRVSVDGIAEVAAITTDSQPARHAAGPMRCSSVSGKAPCNGASSSSTCVGSTWTHCMNGSEGQHRIAYPCLSSFEEQVHVTHCLWSSSLRRNTESCDC